MSASCSQTADVRCARAVGAHEGGAPAAGEGVVSLPNGGSGYFPAGTRG